jgi:hypothetical protein
MEFSTNVIGMLSTMPEFSFKRCRISIHASMPEKSLGVKWRFLRYLSAMFIYRHSPFESVQLDAWNELDGLLFQEMYEHQLQLQKPQSLPVYRWTLKEPDPLFSL